MSKWKYALEAISKIVTKENIKKVTALISVAKELIVEGISLVKMFGSKKSVDVKNATVDEVADINVELNKFYKEVEPRLDKVEKNIKIEIYHNLNQIIKILDNDGEKVIGSGTNLEFITRKIEKIKIKHDNLLKKEVYKKISLDSLRCRRIMEMKPGIAKEKEMENLYKNSVEESISNLIESIDEAVENIREELALSVKLQLEEYEREMEQKHIVLRALSEEPGNLKVQKEEIIAEVIVLDEVSSLILENM